MPPSSATNANRPNQAKQFQVDTQNKARSINLHDKDDTGFKMVKQQGEMRHSTLSTAHSSSSGADPAIDEERPFVDEKANDIIDEDYEQQAEEAAPHDDYPSKDLDGGDDEDSENADFKLVQPYKGILCGSWAEGRGSAIALVFIAAYSL